MEANTNHEEAWLNTAPFSFFPGTQRLIKPIVSSISVNEGATICIPKGVARYSRLLDIALSARSFGASSEITAHDCAFKKILP